LIQKLFELGPISISPFGVMLMLAFFGAYFELRRGLKLRGAGSEEDASALLLAAGGGGILGGKIYYALLPQNSWRDLFSRSGIVWYGGFLLATVLVIWVVRSRKLPVWPTLDAASLGLALGYGVGRIGCFLVGDDYGLPTSLPWGVAFKHGLPPTTPEHLEAMGVKLTPEMATQEFLRVHPTQLYETAIALVIWFLARRFFSRKPPAGDTACLVLILLGLERFGIEFLRVKDDRFFGPFTLAQGISITIVLVTSWLWLRRASERRAPSQKGAA